MSAEITRERSKVNFSLTDYDKIVSDGHKQCFDPKCVIVTPSHTHTHTHPLPHTHTHTHTHTHAHTMYVPLD